MRRTKFGQNRLFWIKWIRNYYNFIYIYIYIYIWCIYRVFNLKVNRILICVIYLLRFTT